MLVLVYMLMVIQVFGVYVDVGVYTDISVGVYVDCVVSVDTCVCVGCAAAGVNTDDVCGACSYVKSHVDICVYIGVIGDVVDAGYACVDVYGCIAVVVDANVDVYVDVGDIYTRTSTPPSQHSSTLTPP